MVVDGSMDGVQSFYCSLVVVGKMKQHLSCGDVADVDGDVVPYWKKSYYHLVGGAVKAVAVVVGGCCCCAT